MREIAVDEPSTFGRVVLKTSKGDLMIELWARECPKACRNFVQLCLEGYYNGCIFHRIIPDFIVQAGDPANSGDTLETIYGEPYTDEIHPRLRFRYRGLLGVASRGKGSMTNGSQFFITLSKQETLSGQHTLFGKLVGDSVYTLSDIGGVEVDKNDRPLGDYPPLIIDTLVIDNPFPDIIPRSPRKPAFTRHKEVAEHKSMIEKPKIIGKKTKLLSFSAGEDEDDETPMKSAHDYADQKSFSSKSHVIREQTREEKLPELKKPDPITKSEEAKPETSPSLPKKDDSILAEIERVKAAIKAAKRPSEPAEPRRNIVASKEEDQRIVKKLRLWGETVSKTKSGQTKDYTDKESSSTLHSLLQLAEDDSSVSGGGWLKSAGPVKFAVDSKTAYQKNS